MTPAFAGGANAAADVRSDDASNQYPFVVSGTVYGESKLRLVATVADVLTTIADWCAADPDATGVWWLNSDYSSPRTVIARAAAGLIPESQRFAHVFVLLPGHPLRYTLTALCGREMAVTRLEWLAVGTGMPCERCLRAAEERAADCRPIR